MKTISKFIKDQDSLDFEIMTKITAGFGDVATSSSRTISDGCGGCQQVDTTDSFNDCNGNGVWDAGESGTSTSMVKQVDCPEQ